MPEPVAESDDDVLGSRWLGEPIAEMVAGVSIGRRVMRVLIADDDRSIGLALQMVLEDLGHECLLAEDGATAWTLFRVRGADAIISDWRMPGLQGPELCRQVRSDAQSPYVYFVLLTVYNDSRHILEAMEAGADDFLAKPFTVDVLRAKLIAAERVTALHRELRAQQAEHRALADERGHLLEQLGRERSQLEAVLRQLPTGVIIAAAPTGEVVMVNDQVERIWRRPGVAASAQTPAAGRLQTDWLPLESPDWPATRSIARGEVVSGEEVEITRRDGTAGTLRVSSAPIYDHERVVAAVTVIDDVTEERRRQQEAAQGEKLRALGQLAGGVAHDLNQSLALVTGYAEIALSTLDQQPATTVRGEIEELLQIITQAAYDGGETVKRLLTFSRGPIDARTEAVHMRVLLDDVAKLTAPRWRDAAQAEGRPIRLSISVDGDAVVEGRPASLREALTNLLFNAVDALPDGGTIELRTRTEGVSVIIEVADSGVGMPPTVQERIFEPFFTTKGVRGTGLGLAQVFGIVEQHQGQMSVESAVGQGTTFRLVLPSAVAVAADSKQAAGNSAQPRRILVIDDDPAIRRMVTQMLAGEGHAVVTARSGETALEALGAEPFDIVVSDLGLGAGMNGWQLAAQIRARWPMVKVVLATGWGAGIDPDAARTRGIAAIIPKPYRPADLLGTLAGL